MNKTEALVKIRPGAEWSWSGTEYSGLNWLDKEQSKPTEQEINDAVAQYSYITNREKEYPNIIDQLDLLYHEGYDGWKAAIKAVKDKYPK